MFESMDTNVSGRFAETQVMNKEKLLFSREKIFVEFQLIIFYNKNGKNFILSFSDIFFLPIFFTISENTFVFKLI